MSADQEARVVSIYRYPVKGLTPEAMGGVDLELGMTLPFDRAYAIENGPGRFDPENPRHLAKTNFLMLMRDERLATLDCRFDDQTETLTIFRGGKQVARGNLTTQIGRQMIEQFMAAYMKGSLRGPPKIVRAPGHSFSDVAAKCIHICNLASLRELERLAGRSLDPRRFRANLYIDGIPAWAELGWMGKTIGLGPAEAKAFKRTRRCDATNVDPVSGVRDTAIPALLLRELGHADFGIYAMVETAGRIGIGDAVRAP